MKSLPPQFQTLLTRTRVFAALHDNFLPAEALSWANHGTLPKDTQTLARVLAMLRPDCAKLPADADGVARWSMRPGVRQRLLASDEIDASDEPFDTQICDALLGRGPYAPGALDALIDAEKTSANLTQIVGTLDRAGPRAKGHDRLVALRGLMNRQRAEKRTDAILGDGFVGREDELTRLANWIATPQSQAPLKALYISGIAGVGKSFLMEQTIQNARDNHTPIFVRLDFDRSGLNVMDRESFIDEISRQVGDGLPDVALMLRDLRLKIAGKDAPVSGGEGTLPQDRLIEAIATVVRRTDRTLLIILDTLEVLRSTGETRIEALFENLDLLAHAGIEKISIIAAGRGNALEPARDRLAGEPIHLTGLSQTACQAFLKARNVPEKFWPRVMALAHGNPLFLLLAAKAVAHDDFDQTEIPTDATFETIGGYLYRAILSRVPDPLRDLATEALILNSVTLETLAAIVAQVIAPDIDKGRLSRAIKILQAQHWLVMTDAETGEIQYRTDVRRAFLPLIYTAQPDRAAAINRQAAAWFKGRDAFEELYHRLQLVRIGGAVPDVPPDLALRFDEFMLEELPDNARDAVRHAQGRRSDFGRAGATAPPVKASPGSGKTTQRKDWVAYAPNLGRLSRVRTTTGKSPDPRAIDDLELLLKKGDLREAEFVMSNALHGSFSPTGRLAQLVLCHFWLTGRWSSAQRLLAKQPKGTLHQAVARSPLLQGRVILEIHAEYHFDDLVKHLRKPAFLTAALDARKQSTRIGINGGALDFALLCALGTAPIPPQLDLARGIMAHNGLDDWPAAERLMHLAQAHRQRHGLRTKPPVITKIGRPASQTTALDLAVLNPYAVPVQAFLKRDPDGAVATYLDRAHDLPRSAQGHLATNLLPTGDALSDRFYTPPDVATAFDTLGLTAEWAMGFTGFNPVADFPDLARAADRWRRLVAGDWCLGRTRPDYWYVSGQPDKTTLDRARALFSTIDPVAVAADQLLLWSRPTHTPSEAAAHLLNRYAARVEKTAARKDHEDLSAVLGNLIRAGIPPLFAAPLAVLIVTGTPLAQALDEPSR